jgi:hypothetical protein
MSEPSDGDVDDVKALLGRALAGEPPLALDRDEVIRAGRRKLRNRKLFSAGGAIAGAVVAVVGAVVLTDLVTEEPAPEAPPAASRTERPAPPGPTLPLSTTAQDPPSSAPAVPTAAYADVLTQHLLAALPADVVTSRTDGAKARFAAAKDTYEFEADVRTASADGSLSVSVGATEQGATVTCRQVRDANDGCTVSSEGGMLVAVGTWQDPGTGEKRHIAYAVHPDGTSVTAISGNLSEKSRQYGKTPVNATPVVDAKELMRIVTRPDLRYSG